MVYLGLSWAILVYHGLSQAISGYLEISLAISGYLWLSWAISGHLGRFMSSIKYQGARGCRREDFAFLQVFDDSGSDIETRAICRGACAPNKK